MYNIAQGCAEADAAPIRGSWELREMAPKPLRNLARAQKCATRIPAWFRVSPPSPRTRLAPSICEGFCEEKAALTQTLGIDPMADAKREMPLGRDRRAG